MLECTCLVIYQATYPKCVRRENIMQNEVVQIKGCCEQCGFPYKGGLTLDKGAFPLIRCPKCGSRTSNFDDAQIVEEQEKAEDFHFDYVDSTFEVIT